MQTSPPESVTFRSAAADDLPLAAELLASEEAAVRGETQSTPAALREWWTLVDHGNDAFFVTASGSPAALGVILAREAVYDSWGCVAPDFWGRGIGASVLARIEERARQLGALTLHHAVYAENERARRLLERGGYRLVRHYYRLEIELDAPPPEPEWPAGFRVTSFTAGDARAFHAALTEAFEDEWHFVATSFEEWKALRLDALDTDTSMWFLVRAGDEVAAAIRCDGERFGGGWIGALGVRRAWRRRGLGLALLQHAFAEFYRRGQRRVQLGVDADNPTGATRLYERAGMRLKDEEVVYAREIR